MTLEMTHHTVTMKYNVLIELLSEIAIAANPILKNKLK